MPKTQTQSAIFYLSWQDGPDRWRFTLPNGRAAFIRAEVVEGGDEAALDQASPRKDETVMNSHEIGGRVTAPKRKAKPLSARAAVMTVNAGPLGAKRVKG